MMECAAELIPLDMAPAVLSINRPVFSATVFATLNPVLVKPSNATLAVFAAAENALKSGRFGATSAAASCGSGVERTNATTANKTIIDAVVFILMVW